MCSSTRRVRACLVVLLLSLAAFAPRGVGQEVVGLADARTLFSADSRYGTLEVVEAAGIRYLFVDDVLQTAMYPDPSQAAKECHLLARRYWLELLPYFRPAGKRCLLIGLGGGLLPAVLDGYGVQTHAVEIDADVLRVAREYFGYRGNTTVGDGRGFLTEQTARYDFIVIDAFAGAQYPRSLGSKESFQLVADHLEPAGILAVNLISKPTGSPVSDSVVRTLRTVYAEVAVYRTESPEQIQSLICFASSKPLTPTLHPHGVALGFGPQQLAGIAEFRVEPCVANGVLLTDNGNLLDREWSDEASQWRRRMIELFRRGRPSAKEKTDDE